VTPGARYQAAIELIDQLAQTRMPLDRLFASWAKAHRYAGSKDRRVIKDIVFQVMRWRGYLKKAAGAEDGRALMLAHLARSAGADLEALSAMFDGQGYNPAALSSVEAEIYRRIAAEDAPEFDPLPDWLDDSAWHLVPGILLEDELTAMAERASVDMRVNTLKSDMKEVSAWFEAEDIPIVQPGIHRQALRLRETGDDRSYVNMRDSHLFKDGKIEFQDLSTQIASALVDARPKMQVLDLCAGAGGKALALAASMENQGQIFASDISKSRLNELRRRAERAGVRNLQIRTITDWSPIGSEADPDFAGDAGVFDRVVLDVPCSGSGVWRRSPDNKWRLTEKSLKGYIDAQISVLRRGAALVKPGGRLIYVTCSLLKPENIHQVQSFMRAHQDFKQLPIEEIWPTIAGLDPKAMGTTIQPQSDGSLLLSPESANTDGCFVAILERQGGTMV